MVFLVKLNLSDCSKCGKRCLYCGSVIKFGMYCDDLCEEAYQNSNECIDYDEFDDEG